MFGIIIPFARYEEVIYPDLHRLRRVNNTCVYVRMLNALSKITVPKSRPSVTRFGGFKRVDDRSPLGVLCKSDINSEAMPLINS